MMSDTTLLLLLVGPSLLLAFGFAIGEARWRKRFMERVEKEGEGVKDDAER